MGTLNDCMLSQSLPPAHRVKTPKKGLLFPQQQQQLPVTVMQELQNNLLRKQVTRR